MFTRKSLPSGSTRSLLSTFADEWGREEDQDSNYCTAWWKRRLNPRPSSWFFFPVVSRTAVRCNIHYTLTAMKNHPGTSKPWGAIQSCHHGPVGLCALPEVCLLCSEITRGWDQHEEQDEACCLAASAWRKKNLRVYHINISWDVIFQKRQCQQPRPRGIIFHSGRRTRKTFSISSRLIAFQERVFFFLVSWVWITLSRTGTMVLRLWRCSHFLFHPMFWQIWTHFSYAVHFRVQLKACRKRCSRYILPALFVSDW
jgi:hypothetical protein